MNRIEEAQSRAIKGKAEYEPYKGKVGSKTCRHGLEHHKCKECSKEYHKDEKGKETEGKESKKTAKKEVSERVKGLKEDEKELPVFMRSKKGLKYSHMQVKKS